MNELDAFQSQDFSTDYRLRVLFSMIPKGGALLDIGSGNGAIAEMRRDSYKRFVLADNSPELVQHLQKKFQDRPNVEVSLQDARHLIWQEEFDVISACDILEHVSEDTLCLQAFMRALKPEGILFISVPAYPWLYGMRDKKYGHVRRYTKKDLRQLLTEAGLEVEMLFYWNAVGFFPYIVSEKILKRPLVAPARTGKGGVVSRFINKALYGILLFESRIHMPFGLSLIAICRKQG